MVPRGLTALFWLAMASTASAATVRGTVMLPAEPRPADRDSHWRVENGVLPIGPRLPDPRLDVVVVLEGGPTGGKPSATDTSITLHGLRLDPRVAVVALGGAIVFKNDDRVPHSLYIEHASSLMPPLPTPASQMRTQKFYAAGEYHVRDEEFPHVDGTVLVLQTPYFARLDEKGSFKLEVPEGKYTLRVFAHDKWVVSQPVEVVGRVTEVTVQVPATATAAATTATAPVAPPPAAGAKP